MSSVQYVRKLNLAGDNQTEQGNLTDLDIVNQIIQDMILVEEAEMRGCAATQEEIDELVESVKFAYKVPEGKELVDAFCKDAGISVDDYFDLIKTQAPTTLARQKLRDAIGEEWCAENGVEFTKVNPPEGMIAAENAFISGLFEAHKSDIEYYIE